MINRRLFTFGLLPAVCLGLSSCKKPQSKVQTPSTAEDALPTNAATDVAANVAAGAAVQFETISQYFVKNTVEPTQGKAELWGICSTQAEFDALFGPAALNLENKFLPENYFDAHVVLYYIQWGDTPWEYKVESLTSEQNALSLKISRIGTPSESATFSPCLLLGVDKSVPHMNLNIEP